MNVLRAIENIRKDVLNFEDMFIESDMPDCFSRIYESGDPIVSARDLHDPEIARGKADPSVFHRSGKSMEHTRTDLCKSVEDG